VRFLKDLRYAFRNLAKSPGFLVLAVITLGLGISANTAIFSLFYQVLLRSLPVPEPDRLAVFHVEKLGMPGRNSSDNYETVFSYPMYRALRDGARSFRGIAIRSGESLQLLENGSAERVQAEVVSGNFFDVLGLRPAAGRLLSQSDDQIGGGNPVIVLSYAYWLKHFGGKGSAVGTTLTLNQKIFTVAGVAPEGFRGVLSGNSLDIYVPLSLLPAVDPGWKKFDRPSMSRFTILGRLNEGVSREQATAELAPLFAATIQDEMKQLKISSPATRKRLESAHLQLVPAARGLNQLERQWKKPLVVLVCMVGLLLVIGCANLANLLLARGVNRSRDTAIRLALGASRSRIISLLLAESLLVAIGGALLGIALTPVLTAGVLKLLPVSESGGWLTGSVSLPVLAFCTFLMAVTGIVSGLAPAWQSSRTSEGSVLADRSASSGGQLSPRVRQGLVVGQLALSLVLLSTAGLFGRSLLNLMRHDPGFRADNLLSFSLDTGDAGYSVERGVALYDEVLKRLAAQPGVQSASIADIVPMSNSDSGTNVTVEGYTAADGEDTDSDFNSVGAGYFRTLGTRVLAGREFDEHDVVGSEKVAIVNQAFVKRFISSQNRSRNPVGMKMTRGGGKNLDLQIVGVVQDLQNMSLRESVKPGFYLPYAQSKVGATNFKASFIVRTKGDPAAMTSVARNIVSQLDRSLPLFDVETMPARLDDSIYTDRLLAALTTAFGTLAMLLTAVGLYGVIAYVVSRRTAEIGIRMALGATQVNVVSLVLREVGLLAIFGVIGGLVLSYSATQAIQSQLFGVKGIDPFILAGTILVLGLVSLLAGAIPAMRAARIQPLAALRHD
jgi:putative ABC transport system permease protein